MAVHVTIDPDIGVSSPVLRGGPTDDGARAGDHDRGCADDQQATAAVRRYSSDVDL